MVQQTTAATPVSAEVMAALIPVGIAISDPLRAHRGRPLEVTVITQRSSNGRLVVISTASGMSRPVLKAGRISGGPWLCRVVTPSSRQ